MSYIRHAVVFTALCVASSVFARNQQRTVFRGGAELILVDVYASIGGKSATGLRADSFQVFEEGKLQEIVYFEERAASGTGLLDQKVGVNQLPEVHERAFLVHLNPYFVTMEAARRMRDPLIAFVRRASSSGDVVGLTTSENRQPKIEFGPRTDVIESVIDEYWKRVFDASPYKPGEFKPLTPKETWLEGCYSNRTADGRVNRALVGGLILRSRVHALLESLRDLVRLLGGRALRTHVLVVSSGWTLPRAQSVRYPWGNEAQLTIRAGRSPGRPMETMMKLTECDAEYARLYSMDARDRFSSLLDEASKSNVSFVVVDPLGLASVSRFEVTQLGAATPDLLVDLATRTGGTAIVRTNDLATPLDKLYSDLATYYLLAYYPQEPANDGSYRRIEVKTVGNGGLKLLARPGYFAHPSRSASGLPPLQDRDPRLEALNALANYDQTDDVVTSVSVRTDSIVLVIERPSSKADSEPQKFDVALLGDSDTPLALTEGHLASKLRSVVFKLAIPPIGNLWAIDIKSEMGPFHVRIPVRRVASEALLSSPVLFRRASPVGQPQHTVRPVFRRTDVLEVEWHLFRAHESAESRLLDRNGMPLRVPVPLTQGSAGGRELRARVLLAPLAPGEYLLELIVSAGSEKVKKLLAFAVTR